MEELTDDVIWALVDAAPDGLVMIDEDGRILLVNRHAEEIFGYDRGELVGASIETLVPPALRDGHVAHRGKYADAPRRREMGSGLELRAARKDGTEIPVEISLSPLHADGKLRVIAAVRDVTERKAVEAAARHAQAELQTLADRERIARDLHDTVIQRLFAAGLGLQATATRIDDGEVVRRIEDIVEQLDETIRELRYAIFDLESRGAGAGLREQIVRVVSEEQESLGFEPRVVIEGSLESVDEDAAANLLPTLREALSNVARHAKATSANVQVRVDADLTLTVTDNGRGLADDRSAGNGLRNMEQRASSLGGSLRLGPGPNGGTAVEWSVPLSR